MPLLDDFLITNRSAILGGTKARVAARPFHKLNEIVLTNGVSIFIAQLGDALRLAKSSDGLDHEQIGRSVGQHDYDLLRMGFT